MKIKLLITIVSAVLFLVCMLIDLKSGQDSTVDKWTSFGMGLTAAIFVAGLIASVTLYRKQKAL